MASENGQEKRDTMADIVAEIRAYGAQPPPRLMWLEIADRIEAAHKRESAEWEAAACACVSDAVMSGKVAVEHVPVGNAAAMREVLRRFLIWAQQDLLENACEGTNHRQLANAIVNEVSAALSAPPRQCDVGTPEEQERRFRKYCETEECNRYRCGHGCKAVCIDRCVVAWAQMPYAAEEGGAS